MLQVVLTQHMVYIGGGGLCIFIFCYIEILSHLQFRSSFNCSSAVTSTGAVKLLLPKE